MKNARIEEITNFLNTIQDYGVNDGAGPEPKLVENKDIATYLYDKFSPKYIPRSMYDLSKAFHDEKCAEYDLLLYQYNKLKAYVEASPDEKIKQLQEEVAKYKRRCELICDIGYDYDGFNTKNATNMRVLVDELVGIAYGDLEEGKQ
jgi:hypothetical protein